MNEPGTLGALCSEIIDCEHKTAIEDSAGVAFSVGTVAMGGGRINFSRAKRISEETHRSWTMRGVPRPGDLILAREAPVGEVVRVPPGVRVALGQRTVLLRPDRTRVDPRFLHYLLLGPQMQERIHERASGSTVAHLNVADVRTLPVPAVPAMSRQTWIAEFLGALDDKIESNAEVAVLAEALLTTHAEAIGSTAMVPLGALAFCDREMIVPSRFASELIDHYSIPAFDAGRVADRCRAETIMSGKFALRGPSILVSRLNPRAPRIWHAVPADRPALCSTEFLVMRPRPTLSLGDIWLACSDPYFFAEMAQRATGTSGSHQRIRPQDALSIEVLDPRQADPAVRAEADLLLQLAHQRRQESRTLAALRDALLPELLSGRLRVPEAQELVESVT